MSEAPFPAEGMEMTQLLVVSDLQRSVAFYRDVLGAELYREYGGTSAVFSFQGTWLLLVTGGGPTEDKPTVTFAPPGDPDTVSHQLTIRVPDCRAAYETLLGRKTTPPQRRRQPARSYPCPVRHDGHFGTGPASSQSRP